MRASSREGLEAIAAKVVEPGRGTEGARQEWVIAWRVILSLYP